MVVDQALKFRSVFQLAGEKNRRVEEQKTAQNCLHLKEMKLKDHT